MPNENTQPFQLRVKGQDKIIIKVRSEGGWTPEELRISKPNRFTSSIWLSNLVENPIEFTGVSKEYQETHRGLNVAVIRENTNLVEFRTFDSFKNNSGENDFKSYIDSIADDQLVIITVCDEAKQRLTNIGINVCKKLGSTMIDQLEYRDSWALITLKGSKKALAEELSKNSPVEITYDYYYKKYFPIFRRTDKEQFSIDNENNLFWQEAQQLPLIKGVTNKEFEYGKYVDTTSKIAIIGSRESAYIYHRNYGNSWIFAKELEGIANESRIYGVAISGAVAVLLGKYNIYIYSQNEGGKNQWGLEAKLDLSITIKEGNESAGFSINEKNTSYNAESVAICGKRIVVGVVSTKDSDIGWVFIYEKINKAWECIKLLSPPNNSGKRNNFGSKVAISGDIIAVGTTFNQESNNTRTVYIYERDCKGDWVSNLISSPSDLSKPSVFGYDLAISGNVVIVGSWSKGYSSKCVHIFSKTRGVWENKKSFAANLYELAPIVAISNDMAAISRSDGISIFLKDYGSKGEYNWEEIARIKRDGIVDISIANDIVILGTREGLAFIYEYSRNALQQPSLIKSISPTPTIEGISKRLLQASNETSSTEDDYALLIIHSIQCIVPSSGISTNKKDISLASVSLSGFTSLVSWWLGFYSARRSPTNAQQSANYGQWAAGIGIVSTLAIGLGFFLPLELDDNTTDQLYLTIDNDMLHLGSQSPVDIHSPEEIKINVWLKFYKKAVIKLWDKDIISSDDLIGAFKVSSSDLGMKDTLTNILTSEDLKDDEVTDISNNQASYVVKYEVVWGNWQFLDDKNNLEKKYIDIVNKTLLYPPENNTKINNIYINTTVAALDKLANKITGFGFSYYTKSTNGSTDLIINPKIQVNSQWVESPIDTTSTRDITSIKNLINIENLGIDTTLLRVPRGKFLKGIQFIQSSYEQGFQTNNRIVPVLICAKIDGTQEEEVCNIYNNNEVEFFNKDLNKLNLTEVKSEREQVEELTGFCFKRSKDDRTQIIPLLLFTNRR